MNKSLSCFVLFYTDLVAEVTGVRTTFEKVKMVEAQTVGGGKLKPDFYLNAIHRSELKQLA